MKRDVLLARVVYQDFDRLTAFLAEKNENAAKSAMTKIRRAIETLDEASERGRPARIDGLRELIVPFGRAAYVVTYNVEPDRVIVLRIHHSLEIR